MGPKEKRLRRARKVRLHISQELGALERGQIDIREVLTSPSPALSRCQIYTVLVHTPKLGPVKVKKILQETQTWPRDRVGQLSVENRREIVKRLPPRVAVAYERAQSKA